MDEQVSLTGRSPRSWLPLRFIAVGGVAIVLYATLLCFGMNPGTALPLALLMGLTSTQFIALIANSKRTDPFAPTTLVAAYFALYFGLRAIWLYYDSAIRLGLNPYDDYVPQALWCACLGYVAFVAGFEWRYLRKFHRQFGKRNLSWPRTVPHGRIVLLLGVSLVSILYLFSIGFVVGAAGVDDFSQRPVAFAMFVEGLLELGWIAICINFFSRRGTANRSSAWFLLLLCGAILAFRATVFGTKVTLIAPALEAMIVFHYLKRRLRLWQLVAVAVPIAILTFGLLNFYRFVVVGRVAGSPTSVGDITSRISAASDFLIRSDKVNSHQSSTLDQLINRSTGVDALALIIKYTPNPNRFAYGRDLLHIPLLLIPRQLWKNKPVQTGGSYLEVDYEGLPHSFRAYTCIHLITDFYRNFYLFGVAIGMFVTGAALRWLYVACSPYTNSAGTFFYAALLPLVTHCLERPAADAVVAIVISVLPVVAVAVVLGVRIRRKNPASPQLKLVSSWQHGAFPGRRHSNLLVSSD